MQFSVLLKFSFLGLREITRVDHRAKDSAMHSRGELLVPQARLAIMQRTAFSVVGPLAWNDLPAGLRSLLMTSLSKFYISFKSFFFGRDWARSASE